MSKQVFVAVSVLLGAASFVPALLAQVAAKAVAKPPMVWEGGVITAFEVKDLAAAKKWYGEVLNCAVFYELPEKGWCEVSTPTANALIGLSQVEAGKTPAGSGGATFSFGVKNIETSRDWLAAHAVKVGELIEIPNVVKLLYFADPDGNKLMLYQPAGE